MDDAALAPEPATLAEDQVEPKPTKEAVLLGHIDATLAPAFRHAGTIGTASLSDLAVLARCFRQALSHLVYGVPDEPVEQPEPFDALGAAKQEALDLQRAEQAAAAQKAAEDKQALLDSLAKPAADAETQAEAEQRDQAGEPPPADPLTAPGSLAPAGPEVDPLS